MAGVPRSSVPFTTLGTSSALPGMSSPGPTVVLPKAWKVPTYLEQSAFYERFTVGRPSEASSSSFTSPGSLPPATSSADSIRRSGSISGLSRSTTATTITPTSSTYDAGGKGKARALAGVSKDTSPQTASPATPIPLPSRLDSQQCCKRLLITKDYGLQFMPERDEQGREKINRHDPDKDAAAVRADVPIPHQAGVYYYEVEVISRGQKGYIGIGFSTKNVSLERLPGWNAESYGYHGDDGKAFSCSGTGSNYGPKFGSGDVIGCGIDFLNKKAFFVKNGNWLGYVFDLTNALSYSPTKDRSLMTEKEAEKDQSALDSSLYYPTIGLQTVGENVRVNFGQDAFKFDILAFVKRRKQEMTESVLATTIPRSLTASLITRSSSLPTHVVSASFLSTNSPSSMTAVDYDDPFLRTALQNLVASYLSHKGYSATVRSFRAQREVERRDWDALLEANSQDVVQGSPADEGAERGSGGTKKLVKSTKRKGPKGGSSKGILKSALRTTLSRRNEDDDEGEDGGAASTTPPTGTEDAEMDITRSSSFVALPSSSSAAVGTDVDTTPPSRQDSDTKTGTAVRDDLMLSDVKAMELGRTAGPRTLTRLRRDSMDLEEKELLDSHRRETVCSAIRAGDIDTALKELTTNYSGVLGDQSLSFKLHCRKFVELILACNGNDSESSDEGDVDMDDDDDDDDTEEEQEVASALISSRHASPAKVLQYEPRSEIVASQGHVTQVKRAPSMDEVLSYGAHLNELYGGKDRAHPAANEARANPSHTLKTIFSLIAYTEPQNLGGEIGYLCSQAARDELAEEINSAMLESQGRPGRPLLETVFRHAEAVRRVLGDTCHEGRAALVGDVFED